MTLLGEMRERISSAGRRYFYGFIGREKFLMFPDETPEGKQRHAWHLHSQPLGPTPSPDEVPDRPRPLEKVTIGAAELALAQETDGFVSGLQERRR
jgi:hypothetical protein